MNAAFLNETVARIYETIETPSRWENVLKLIAEQLNFTSGIVGFDNPVTNLPYTHFRFNLPDRIDAQYTKDHNQKDYLKKIFLNDYSDGKVHFDFEMTDTEAYFNTAIHQDINAPANIHQLLGGNIQINDLVSARLTFYRSHDSPIFDESIRSAMDQLLPHVWRAIKLRLKLMISESQTNLYSLLLEHLNVFSILVDRNLNIRNNSNNIVALRESNDLTALKIIENKVVLNDETSHQALTEVVKHDYLNGDIWKAQGKPHNKTIYADSTIEVEILPYRLPQNNTFFGEPGDCLTLLIVRSGFTFTKGQIEKYCKKLGITSTEFTICLALARGLTIPQFAAKQNKSEHTVRSQLKLLFKKLGVRNQAGLVGVFMSSLN